jgi:hypothetical protein
MIYQDRRALNTIARGILAVGFWLAPVPLTFLVGREVAALMAVAAGAAAIALISVYAVLRGAIH